MMNENVGQLLLPGSSGLGDLSTEHDRYLNGASANDDEHH